MKTIAHFLGRHLTILLLQALNLFKEKVSHHNIVEEGKEEADNDNGKSKSPLCFKHLSVTMTMTMTMI